MTNRFVKKTEVRCPCARRPLLGMTFRTDSGELVFHVKAHKQNRILAEVLITDAGEVRCRECLTWHIVKITGDKCELEPRDVGRL